MKKIMNQLKSKGGFTLVELMIVLSIIAILAVVLVPKVGQMKDSVREQGVNTNINSVRGFLELQVANRDANATTETTRLINLMNTTFATGNAIKNPMTNNSSIGVWAGNVDVATHSVIVYAWATPFVQGTFEANGNYTGTYLNRKGKVIVWVCNDAYIVWGHLANGKTTPYQVVR